MLNLWLKTDSAKISTSKIILYLLMADFIVVQLFGMIAIVVMLINSPTTGIVDFSPLNALIGSVVAQVLTFLIYAWKSFNESKEEANHEYRMAELDLGEYVPDESGEGEV